LPQPYPLTIERLLNPTSNKRTIYSLWAEHSYNEKVLPKSIKKHQLPTPRTRHSLTEVASLRSAAHGGAYIINTFFLRTFGVAKIRRKIIPTNKIRRNLRQRLLRYAQQPTGGVYYQ